MFKSVFLISAGILISQYALSDDHFHTDEVCQTISTSQNEEGDQVENKICYHLGFPKPPTSSKESQFILHFTSPNGLPLEELKEVKVNLWMNMGEGHGHGTSPVTVERLDREHFRVTKAYFVMPGNWSVKVKFEYLSSSYNLEVPVKIAE